MQHNKNSLFVPVLGSILLFVGFACICLALFLIPQVFFGVQYKLPDIFYRLLQIYEHHGLIDHHRNLNILFQIFLYIGLILIVCARLILIFEEYRQRRSAEKRELEHQQDDGILPKWQNKTREEFTGVWAQSTKSRIHPFIYNLLMILVSILAILLIEWLIYG